MSIAFTGMFLRQCFRNKDGKRHAYWALVESFRTDAGPRQRIVAWLGKLDEAGRLGIEQAARDANSTHSKTSTTARDDQLPLFNRQVDEAPAAPQWVELMRRAFALQTAASSVGLGWRFKSLASCDWMSFSRVSCRRDGNMSRGGAAR